MSVMLKAAIKARVTVDRTNYAKYRQRTAKFRKRSDKPKLNNLLRNGRANWEPNERLNRLRNPTLAACLSDTYKLYFYSNRAYVPR